MPLQSLTQRAMSNEQQALGKFDHNSQLNAHCLKKKDASMLLH
jgi:hypothetical protein